MVQSNAAPVPPTNPTIVTPTNVVSATPINPVAPLLDNSGPVHSGTLVIGVVLLIAAVALALLAFFRSRRTDDGSLITRSMRKD